MSDLLALRFKFDPSGQANSNLVIDELHPIADNGSRIVVPREGVVYTREFTIRPAAGGPALIKNVDYHFIVLDIEVTARTGLESAGAIEIDNPQVIGDYYLTYHAVGGILGKSNALVHSLIESIRLASESTINWTKIINVPAQFPPEQHDHQVTDLTGLEAVTQALNGLERAILDSRPLQLSGNNLHWQNERILNLLGMLTDRMNGFFIDLEDRLRAYIDDRIAGGGGGTIPDPVDQDAIAHYTYDTITNLVVADERGTYPATITDVETRVTGIGGDALMGDGTDYITMTNLGAWFANRTVFSFCGFFKPALDYTGVAPLLCVSVPNNANPKYRVLLKFTINTLGVYVGNYGSNVEIPNGYDHNTFYHIAVVYASSAYKIYLNGLLVSTVTEGVPASIGSTHPDALIGRVPAANDLTNASEWTVDELRFYNRSLTAAEILTLSDPGHYEDPEMYPGLNVYDAGAISGPSPLIPGSVYEPDVVDLNPQ